MALKSFRELVVWQRSMQLVLDVYKLTQSLPSHERFGLASQMQRSAVSIPTNIAEGYGRTSTREYLRFLEIARGSLQELDTLLELVSRLRYESPPRCEVLQTQIVDIRRLLAALIRALLRREASRNAKA
ncbi:MAG: four helix bundle protein [Phycisphaerae bacterium]|nr:four helix bundle protein [Phycisphaerae bacterium]